MHYGLRGTSVIQLVTTYIIFNSFFPSITELVNNIQHSVGEIQHFCVLEKQIHLVNMLESVLRPPNLTNSSLLAVQVVDGVICHGEPVIQEGYPFQDLHEVKVPASQRSVCGVIGIQVSWEILHQNIGIILLVVKLVKPLVKG